ncbi:MAG: NADP-dependent oxidoreductase [Candidatus Curtissbacteria bacterium]|nr:NADP-dependent oxidoreductase [Candidatus Curtissbacteria bacterium]
MKAVQFSKYGGVDVLEVKDVPKPTPSSGQVLVEVKAVSINPFDWKVREGYVKDHMPLDLPITIGGDFAGVVADAGDSDYKVGDEVYGQAAAYGGGSGAFAEFAAASTGKIAAKPTNINFEEAAAIPLAGQSALQALQDDIKLEKGQKILIHGGAGGIGSLAVQIAKAMGVYVIATAASDDLDYVKGLGTDEVIDYEAEDFTKKVKDVDAVFNTADQETADKSLTVVKKGGVVASMTGEPDPKLAKKLGVKGIAMSTNGDTAKLEKLKNLIENGEVKPQVDKVFSLDEVKEAFTHQEKGHPRGKVVLSVGD